MDRDRSSLRRRIAQASTDLPPVPHHQFGIPREKLRNFSPKHWSEYFDVKRDIEVDRDIFCVYTRGKEGPVLFFLHGGGYSALSFALLSVAVTKLVDCQCVSLDIRGHGDTVTTNDADLSCETLANDVCRVLKKMYGKKAPPVILVGHSLGGAVAVKTASHDEIPTLAGLVVIDVVEGTAMESLNGMQSFLSCRPMTFESLAGAIEWSIKFGQIKNLESARVSVPGHLKRIRASEFELSVKRTLSIHPIKSFISVHDVITEDEEDEGEDGGTAKNTNRSAKKPKEDQIRKLSINSTTSKADPSKPTSPSTKAGHSPTGVVCHGRPGDRKSSTTSDKRTFATTPKSPPMLSLTPTITKLSPRNSHVVPTLCCTSPQHATTAGSHAASGASTSDGHRKYIAASNEVRRADQKEQEHDSSYVYTWRINLAETERHWTGWFHDMNKLFLGARVPKLLLLAGMDRLDKELTIGQMQGKFHLQVLQESGHSVHEDVPDRVAEILATFMIRNKLVDAPSNFICSLPAC